MDKENVVCTYSRILFSHKKEGKSLIYNKRMNLEDIVLRERSQTQKDKYCMIPLMRHLSIK